MHFSLPRLFVAALAVQPALSAPSSCNRQEKVLSKLLDPRLRALASSFCSTFIRSTTSITATATATTTNAVTVTVTTPSSTVTLTQVQTTTVTAFDTTQLPPDTVSTYATTTVPEATVTSRPFKKAKRDASPEANPEPVPNGQIPAIFPFVSSQLSSACTCLITSAPTRTITASTTVTNTVAVTGITTVADGIASTEVSSLTTVIVTSTITLPPTATNTVYTSTSTVSSGTTTVVPPALCGNRRGSSPRQPSGQYQALFSVDRSACQSSCAGNPICKCIVYADVSRICSLHTLYCDEIFTAGSALLYYDKNCP